MAYPRVDRISSAALQLAPTAWLAFFFLFVARATFETGHLPSDANPDPKNLGMDLHLGLLWLFLYLMPWLICGYGLVSLRMKFPTWKIAGSLALLSLTLLIAFGPQFLFWPAIWITPLVSFGALVAILVKGAEPQRVKWFYGVSLIALNIWLYADPLRLMEWFYD